MADAFKYIDESRCAMSVAGYDISIQDEYGEGADFRLNKRMALSLASYLIELVSKDINVPYNDVIKIISA